MLLVEEPLSLLVEDLVDVSLVFALSLGVALQVGLSGKRCPVAPAVEGAIAFAVADRSGDEVLWFRHLV